MPDGAEPMKFARDWPNSMTQHPDPIQDGNKASFKLLRPLCVLLKRVAFECRWPGHGANSTTSAPIYVACVYWVLRRFAH